MSSRTTTILVGVWATAILVALLISNSNQMQDFDPDASLAQAASQQDFDSAFTGMLQEAGVSNGSIVHLSADSNCFCNDLSKGHQYDITQSLADKGYEFNTLSLSENPAIGKLISHFPALAVIDNNGNLRYVGPYATGFGCFTGNDLVDDIARIATTEQYFGATVNTEARGCFCNV